MTTTLNDLIDPQELVGFARSLTFDDITLDKYLPNREDMDIEYRFKKNQLIDEDSAEYRAWDAEAPIGKRQGVARVSGELPPISKKFRLNEEERLRLRMLNNSDTDPIIDAIYDDARKAVRSIQVRLELARGQALTTGTVVISENGVVATVDFGRNGAHTQTAGVLWSTTASATPITDIQAWMAIYYANTGRYPTQMLISRRVLNLLLLNTALRNLFNTSVGAPGQITVDQLQSLFSAYGLPAIVVYDASFRQNGSLVRPIADNKVVFLPEGGLGNTFLGVTAEALVSAQSGVITTKQAPGIWCQTWSDNDPVGTWTLGTAVGIPVVGNPDLTFTATVAS
jgi:major capsid protein E